MSRTPHPLVDGTGVPGADRVASWAAGLVEPGLSDAERVDRIRACEDLKAQLCAAQARLSVDLDVSQCEEQTHRGVPADQRGRGVAGQVALARRESPHRGGTHLGLAKVLVHEMPHALAAMEAGVLSEWRATLVARETACLSREDRAAVDTRLFADPATAEGWGDRRLVAEAKKIGYTLDPRAVVDRARREVSERRVSVRPVPETMSQVTALLPAAQGIAVWACLGAHADRLRAQGDPRTRGQIMADTLVVRVTGQDTAEAVPVAVNMTLSDQTLIAGGTDPAWLGGHGPIPAALARELTATATEQALATLRKLYVSPTTGQLTALESVARTFPAGLGLFLDLRDQSCRTPWCDAPVRHHDHIEDWAVGGPTTGINGQGLCEQCNHTKQAPGWTTTTDPPDPFDAGSSRHRVTTTTPTGHQVTSTAPDLPRPAVQIHTLTRREKRLLELVLAV
ncbi:HNH endonuclease signature motif containing protein [Nocardioides dongkuii]|uniref:HNH endonuclease signature motif containing protein n=1 Tax=Nocardioides dongkuii TaxID=2760089 RepID=UPI0015FA6AFD|nr:HNH endonuclease signature motif containing protein [Nocardioides dongkuii]